MKKDIFSLSLLFLFVSTPVFATEITTPGESNWTVPNDAAKIRVELWGGGGAGGSGNKTKNHHISGFGGGAGGFASEELDVTPGDVYQIKVGAGGKFPGAGGSNSEFSKNGQAIVGAGGGGGGMSAVGNYSGSGTSGSSGIGPGAGAGGTNSSYVQRSSQIIDYEIKWGGSTQTQINYAYPQSIFVFIETFLKPFMLNEAFAQTSQPPEPDFDANYVGVAGQGGRGYEGSIKMRGENGSGYIKFGDNPYASSGGSSPSGGSGGSRGRLGRDGSGCCVTSDTRAMDGNAPGGAGGGSDTGTGGYGADGKVMITVIESLHLDVCPNIDGIQSELPPGKTLDANGDCVSTSTVVTPVTPPAKNKPVGWLENASCSVISGWTYDVDTPTDQISVRFYDGPLQAGKLIANISTNQLRVDVNDAEGITGNHGYSFAVPAYLKDGQDHLINAYGINSDNSNNNTLLLGSPKTLNCPSIPPPVINPIVGIVANPNSLTSPGTVNLTWNSSGADFCYQSWSPTTQKPVFGTEISPRISRTTTFSVVCGNNSGGSNSDSVTVPLMNTSLANTPLVVQPQNAVVSQGNGVLWNSINTPNTAQTNQAVTFTANVKNTGTKTWNTNYRFVMKNSSRQGIIEVPPPYSVTPGQSADISFNLTMPSAAGAYTYYFQALEPNVEWFGPEPSRSITATAVTVNNNVAPTGSCLAAWNNTNPPLPAGYVCYSKFGNTTNGAMPVSGSAPALRTDPNPYPLICNDFPTTGTQTRYATISCPTIPVTNQTNSNTSGNTSSAGYLCPKIGPASIRVSGNTATVSWSIGNNTSFSTYKSCRLTNPTTGQVIDASNPIVFGSDRSLGTLTCIETVPWEFPVTYPLAACVPAAPSPNFTVSVSSPVKIQTIPTVGGTSREAIISIGPANGFNSPITLTIGPISGWKTVQYSWNNSEFGNNNSYTVGPSTNGYPPVNLRLRVTGNHNVNQQQISGTATGGGKNNPFTYMLEINKTDTVFNEE